MIGFVEVLVHGHLLEVEYSYIAGAPETAWGPAEGYELDIKNFKLINIKNENWDDESPEEFMEWYDLKSEVYESVCDEIFWSRCVLMMENSHKPWPKPSSAEIDSHARMLRERFEAEKKIVIIDRDEIESLYRECGEPTHVSDGQFTGGYYSKRFIHPYEPDRSVLFQFDPRGKCYEAVTWIPYGDYAYST